MTRNIRPLLSFLDDGGHCGNLVTTLNRITLIYHGYDFAIADHSTFAFDQYGIDKAAIEAYLLEEAQRSGFPANVLHPGHIVGPGWMPLNPAANFNRRIFELLSRGEEILLPNIGMETVHHVHADVAGRYTQTALVKLGSAHLHPGHDLGIDRTRVHARS